MITRYAACATISLPFGSERKLLADFTSW